MTKDISLDAFLAQLEAAELETLSKAPTRSSEPSNPADHSTPGLNTVEVPTPSGSL